MASYDLVVVTDATASMGQYLASLTKSIPEILALTSISGAFKRVGVVAYKDYTEPNEVVTWSGWNSPTLTDFVENLAPTGGGDYPEAAKSALIRVIQEVQKVGSSNTLVLWYTDAPPHHPSVRSYNNDQREIRMFPADSTDWVKLSHLARERNITIFSFIPRSLEGDNSASFYTLLSELTGGLCTSSDTLSDAEISRLTLEIVLHWMGQGGDINKRLEAAKVNKSLFKDPPRNAIPGPADELDQSYGYLPPSLDQSVRRVQLRTILCTQLHAEDIPLAGHPLEKNFVKRLRDPAESEYRNLVYVSLHQVIKKNVHALTYNNVFGQIWRAVCSQDSSPDQIELLNAFSLQVGSVTDPEQKEELQQWLENSYDATAKIDEMIAKAGSSGPKICLDLDTTVDLTRMELLEVSKSFYSVVLKRVASVFTHLKLVEGDVEMAPGHRFIPLSMSAQDIFRTIPHLVVPGTLYPPRSSSITAVLALITGVPFLREKALEVLEPLKGTWINLETPESVSFECAKFLLSAPEGLVLAPEEKEIYQAMRRYRLIELNMETTITVKLGWTPNKTADVGDRKVTCSSCHIMRSVTLMSEDVEGFCGYCAEKDEQASQFEDHGEMASCWVECSVLNCRAQYVVINHKGLKVRPKCWYCRQNRKCPWQQCSRCQNRVIVPIYLRENDTVDYLCTACQPASHVTSIVVAETTPKDLIKANGMNWLGIKPNEDFFKGKSAFKLMLAHGTAVFNPVTPGEQRLVLHSKPIHDPEVAVEQVEVWVQTGTVELGSCALCFGDTPKNQLLPACGRRGCYQRAHTDCLREWYAKPEPGHILNLMEFACPFCRRIPDHRTMARYNPRAMGLGGLKDAFEDRQWFYAWCIECGFARQAFERVCAQGPLPPLRGYQCPPCVELSVQAAQAEDEAAENRHHGKAELPAKRITCCPTCEVAIEKIAGCNHITCTCGTHFCHVCGAGDKSWSPDDCYEHLNATHGGIWEFDMGDDQTEDGDDGDE